MWSLNNMHCVNISDGQITNQIKFWNHKSFDNQIT